MTPLERLIREEIALDGPIRLDRYMALCLGHPEHGYYRARDPIGRSGDFVTSPEVSQIFGELIGLWLVETWRAAGRPTPASLVELGPGRGVLMADAWRATAAAPDFRAAVRLHLVETSRPLRAAQRERLGDADPVWLDGLSEAPDAPLFLIANEFFDALPIRQFRRVGAHWVERRVALGEQGFTFVDPPADPPDHPVLEDATPPSLLETCAAGAAVAAEIGRRLGSRGGAALIIDYGYGWTALRAAGGADTFQAMRRHARADPLAAPGEADLTAHVDFDALRSAAQTAAGAARLHAFASTQGALLRSLGAEPRAAALARAQPERVDDIAAGLHRLTHPAEMGRLFKAMALSPKADPPPGFAAPKEAGGPAHD